MESVKKEILIAKGAIDQRVQELAKAISDDYRGGDLILIGILKGAFVFMADLVRHLDIPCTIDFVRLASYGAASATSGKIIITKDIETFIRNKDVLIVEDIVDTGLTLTFLVKWLQERNPRSLKVCAFLDKKPKRKVPLEADYVGFSIKDRFVVGYGLDFDERFRYLPEVYAIQT